MPAPIPAAALYRGYRFPPEIISYAVWLYLRFSLSLRDVEELLADRGLAVTYETIGQWVRRFGPVFAQELRRRGRRPGDKLHLDEVALKINGQRHWLWRAVDQHGFVVDILVQSRRDQHAAEAFIRRAVGGWDYTPRVVITDKLASYPPALRRVLPNSEHRRQKGLNNPAENSHLPTRQRERRMQRFKSSEQAQRFPGALQHRLQSLPPAPASPHGNRLPPAHGRATPDLARSHRGSGCPLASDPPPPGTSSAPAALINLTTPVKDHSESDLRVDPTNPNHLIGSSKWFVSPEVYNHLLGFYESFDGGQTWTVQGHIPGYEGWTDNTDPVGAFDSYGNYYSFILAYQFYYNSDGSHNFNIGTPKEPNPGVPAEVVAVSVRPHGATTATQWTTSHNGGPDYVATYDSIGNEPDKQWITIDANPKSPHFNRVYVMWVDFHFLTPIPMVSFADANRDGTHTDWSAPQALPMGSLHPEGDTYLLPHVDPNGVVYTTLTNFNPKQGFCCVSIILDKSSDGGNTWSVASTVVQSATPPPLIYPNTTFRDGIENTFSVSSTSVKGHYPLNVSWEDFSAGVDNVILSGSFDGGETWSAPIQVNDNAAPVDELQPNLTVSANGTVSNAFYDRRLACPTAGTAEAVAAGIALDQAAQNPDDTGPVPPYGATNYCVDASVQYYTSTLKPVGQNIRLTQHTWDPQLNAAHPGSPTGEETFIGDYFGNITSSVTNFFSFTSTFNEGANPANRQQQVIARITIPSAR